MGGRIKILKLMLAMAIVCVPSIFAVKNMWFMAVPSLVIVLLIYFKSPVFLQYKSDYKDFDLFVIMANISGFLLGLVVFFKSEFLVGGTFLWMIIFFIFGLPIAKQLDKEIKADNGKKESA